MRLTKAVNRVGFSFWDRFGSVSVLGRVGIDVRLVVGNSRHWATVRSQNSDSNNDNNTSYIELTFRFWLWLWLWIWVWSWMLLLLLEVRKLGAQNNYILIFRFVFVHSVRVSDFGALEKHNHILGVVTLTFRLLFYMAIIIIHFSLFRSLALSSRSHPKKGGVAGWRGTDGGEDGRSQNEIKCHDEMKVSPGVVWNCFMSW